MGKSDNYFFYKRLQEQEKVIKLHKSALDKAMRIKDEMIHAKASYVLLKDPHYLDEMEKSMKKLGKIVAHDRELTKSQKKFFKMILEEEEKTLNNLRKRHSCHKNE